MTATNALLGPDSVAPGACAGRTIVDHVMSKWGMLVMIALAERCFRYAELRRRVGGVSERMLALTLRTLETDGLVERTDFGEVPPRVEYALTPLGRSLAHHLEALGAWIVANTDTVLAARAAAAARSAPADRSSARSSARSSSRSSTAAPTSRSASRR